MRVLRVPARRPALLGLWNGGPAKHDGDSIAEIGYCPCAMLNTIPRMDTHDKVNAAKANERAASMWTDTYVALINIHH